MASVLVALAAAVWIILSVVSGTAPGAIVPAAAVTIVSPSSSVAAAS